MRAGDGDVHRGGGGGGRAAGEADGDDPERHSQGGLGFEVRAENRWMVVWALPSFLLTPPSFPEGWAGGRAGG